MKIARSFYESPFIIGSSTDQLIRKSELNILSGAKETFLTHKNKITGYDVDSSGNLYVADDGNNRIQKFTNNGDFVTMWGSKGSKNGQLDRPHDIAVESSGDNDVYVAEQGNFRIQKFTADGKFIKKWGTEGIDDNQFQDPHSVVVY
jgi:DNA-binding beta-propeller fold protein YncE